MPDTRPEMTQGQFAAASTYADPHGLWLTGEEMFLHIPAVMQVDDWDVYGDEGNNSLTEAQRVLMMWSDLVGQTCNGGFTQFAYNFRDNLAQAYQLISKLEWPELFEKFDVAFREQAGDPENPELVQESWYPDLNDWPENRQIILNHLAEKHTRWRPWARQREYVRWNTLSDTILNTFYNAAVEAGEIVPVERPVIDVGDPPTEAAEAFDDWFYQDQTKENARKFVGDYIRLHRDQLRRLTD